MQETPSAAAATIYLAELAENKRKMIIQCIGKPAPGSSHFYSKGRMEKHLATLLNSGIPNKQKFTWKYNTSLSEHNFEYLYIYSRGRPLKEFSLDLEEYEKNERTIEAQMRSCKSAQVDARFYSVSDILTSSQLYRWLSAREAALENLCSHIPPTEEFLDYDILQKAHILTSKISKRNIEYKNSSGNIEYNIFGSATGRLVTTPASIPILTMKTASRQFLKPTNDLFVEIDLNGAEIRTLLSLSGQEQPQTDIHEWNLINCTRGLSTRKKVKERFFAWLYNPEATDHMLERYYNRAAYQDYYDGNKVTTPFGRGLQVGEKKALNYLLQSTTSDIVIESAYKIMNFLSPYRSSVAFTMHDSIVLDWAQEEVSNILKVKELFEKNRFGKFLSTVSVGKDYYNMKKIDL